MGQTPLDNPNSEHAVDALLAEFMRRTDAGEQVDREEFIAAHPEWEVELREVLETAALVEFMAGPECGSGSGIEDAADDVDGEAATLPPTNSEEITRTVPDASESNFEPMEPCEFGDYELLEVIGRGGMGVVYKARQVKMDRIVAVKMIRSGRLASEEDVQRFYTEAQAAGKIDHPNIVTIYEVNQIDGHHFFSMDYVEGRDLAAVLKEGLLDSQQTARYLRDAALAIHAAHETGVLHRDMKPGNVLIDNDDRVLITDFGLAKHIDQNKGLTETGTTMGTPNYMPPEQASGDLQSFGPPTDVYSLGAVLFVMLTGRTPFRSESIAQTIFNVIHTDPPMPRSINKNADVDLETICLKCLAKQPANRYSSAAELAADLDRFLNGQSILAKPITPLQKCWNWVSQIPLVAALVGRHVVSPSPTQIATQRAVLGLALAVPIAFWCWHLVHQASLQAMPAEIRITTGNEVGLYYEFGTLLAERLEATNGKGTDVTSSVISSLGSLQNQQRLIAGEANLALIQIDALNEPAVAVVSPLYFEVAFVLVRADSGIQTIVDLQGKRIAIGTHESGTRVAAEQILEFYGITEKSYTAIERDFDEFETESTIDVAIAITGENNTALRRLINSDQFRLISLPRTEQLTSEYGSFKTYHIHLSPEDEGISTVRTAAVLAARRDAPDVLIRAALEAVYSEPALHSELMSRRQASSWLGLDLHRVSREFFHGEKK